MNNKNQVENLIYEAISVSPNVVTPMLNKDGGLERKTHQVWIKEREDRMFILRDSTSAPGQYSNDIYKFSTLNRLGEDEMKYSCLPKLPAGAFEHFVFGNITCSAMVMLDDSYIIGLATSLRLVLGSNR